MAAISTSFVWTLFQIHDKSDVVAECLICNKKIKRGRESEGQKAFSTTPLHNHLKKQHPDDYKNAREEAQKLKASESSSTSSVKPKEKKLAAMSKQLTLMESFASKKIWDINDHRSKAINEKIMKMMALDNQPFSIVEDDGFIDLMAHLQPRYMLPSRRYFSDTMLPQAYDNIKTLVENELAEPDGKYVSFTSDIWTCSKSKETFISLSGHWIKQDFNRVDAVLHATHFPGSHTGANIANMFCKMWESWKISESRRQLLVRDGAANMCVGGELAEIESIHCTVHRLQLVIEDAILVQRAFIDLLAKYRRLVTHFNHSALACNELKMLQEEQGKAPLLPVQDVPTRWNSAYLMVERMVKLKRPIQLYVSDHDGLPTITANEWQLSERFLHILKPFFDLTKEMSAEYSILSTVIPNIATLELFLSKVGQGDQGVQSTRESLLLALRKRFFSTRATGPNDLNIMKDKHYVTATSIDPRYKNHFFKETQDKEKAKTWMLELVVEVHGGQSAHLEDPNISEEDYCQAGPSAKKAKPDDLFRACFDEITSQHQSKSVRNSDTRLRENTGCLVEAAEEVDRFMVLPLISRTANPLEWWGKATGFPLLRELARKLLCTPSSSVFSERMYSEYGNIFEDKRSRLLPSKGEKLLFMHHNARKF